MKFTKNPPSFRSRDRGTRLASAQRFPLLKSSTRSQLYTGFTLAEVLTVLGIIGVVAAMTIPGLINNTNRQESVTKLKKIYATLTQAFKQAETNGDTVNAWGWTAYGDGTGSTKVLDILAAYINISKNCDRNTGCFPNVTYKYLNNTSAETPNSDNNMAKAILNDGTSIAISTRSATCSGSRGTSLALQNYCGDIYVDINGKNAPNQWGKDFFAFYITKYGVIPIGTSPETLWPVTNCTKSDRGISCSAWVLEKGNMNYLN